MRNINPEVKERLRQRLYVVSPFNLASPEDDRYRDNIDQVLDDDSE